MAGWKFPRFAKALRQQPGPTAEVIDLQSLDGRLSAGGGAHCSATLSGRGTLVPDVWLHVATDLKSYHKSA